MAVAKILEIQQDTIGVVLTFQTGISLVDTTSMLLRLKKPSGTVDEIALTPLENITNTATGEVSYTVQSGDLDELGKYKGQLVDNSTGRYLPSKVFEFKVVANV